MDYRVIEYMLGHVANPAQWVHELVSDLELALNRMMLYDARGLMIIDKRGAEHIDHDEIKLEVRDKEIIPLSDWTKTVKDGKYKCILLKIEQDNDNRTNEGT